MTSESTTMEMPLPPLGHPDKIPHPHWRNRARLTAAILFVIALFIPLVGTAMHWDPVESHENRALAKAPGLPKSFQQATRYSDLMLGFYRDHFGFRNALIRGLTLISFHGGLALDQQTKIIIGKDGWLFYPPGFQNLLADRNLDPFTSQQLDDWQQVLEHRYWFCANHGIRFLVLIPPDKQSVYREFMPEQFSALGPQSRLDQLIERLRVTHSPVDLLDLRPTLIQAKKYHRVYFKTDTHWNDYGAFACYPVVLDEINRLLGTKMVPQPASDFVPASTVRSGDLAGFMNLYYEYNEDWLHFIRRRPFPLTFSIDNPFTPVITRGDPHGPTMFVLHDSFGNYFGPFLGPHFSRADWQWTNVLGGPLILKAKPDVVIDEFLERMLYLPQPMDTEDVRNTPLQRREEYVHDARDNRGAG
ncbi:MAG: hypothetical protein ABSB42_07465 [Tepidisphaeraceae bacterium]|jgi:alginate O-acetyltransferase complex protein AlgJ